jgi:hypothetical protein
MRSTRQIQLLEIVDITGSLGSLENRNSRPPFSQADQISSYGYLRQRKFTLESKKLTVL